MKHFFLKLLYLVERPDASARMLWTWLFSQVRRHRRRGGSRYYRWRGGEIDKVLGFERRWVVYNGLCRGLEPHSAVMAWLDAPHSGHSADRGKLQAPSLGDVAPGQSDRHAGAYRPPGSTLGQGQAARRPPATTTPGHLKSEEGLGFGRCWPLALSLASFPVLTGRRKTADINVPNCRAIAATAAKTNWVASDRRRYARFSPQPPHAPSSVLSSAILHNSSRRVHFG